jgi:hypothetical protein
MVEWFIKGREFANCNCDYGCPCQFNALPTTGNCEAAVGYLFDDGRFGDVSLKGVKPGLFAHWPGAIHEGGGTMQLILDEASSEAQRDAVARIMKGEETEPMTTMWSVFAAMTDTFLEALVKPISLEVDVEARKARLSIPGVVETTAEPIRNPVSGAEHRARIDLPNGFEYRLAEMASGNTRTGPDAGIQLDLQNSYGQLAEIHLGHTGRLN